MKKVLYLHGFNSKLQDDRQKVLENFDLDISAPQINYEEEPDMLLNTLAQKYKGVDFIIGSSAGGLVAYYLSALLNVPTLIFNPALTYAKNYPTLPQKIDRKKLILVVLGVGDEVINPKETFQILNQNIVASDIVEIHWRNQMQHSYPINIFKEELQYFLQKL